MTPCSCRPLKLGKDGWGSLEGRSEAWLSGRSVQGRKNPEATAIEKRRNPGKRKRFEQCSDGMADFRCTRYYKCQQCGKQQQGNHPTDAGEQKRLIVGETQHQQAEARSIRCLYVSLWSGHRHPLRVIVQPGRCFALRRFPGHAGVFPFVFMQNWHNCDGRYSGHAPFAHQAASIQAAQAGLVWVRPDHCIWAGSNRQPVDQLLKQT
jgi:hypothetical protein